MLFFIPDFILQHPWWPVFMGFLLVVYVGMTLVQIVFHWIVYARFAFYKEQAIHLETEGDYPQEGISVVICARNEAANLLKNLPAVLEQDYPYFEVIVVNDDSDDATRHVLDDFQKKYPHLRVLQLVGKMRAGKKDALSDGVDISIYENIVLTDADCRPNTNQWLRQMTERFTSSNEIVLGYGPYAETPGLLNKWIRYEAVHTAKQYFSFALVGMPYMGVGRNIAWKKKLFKEIGGFRGHAHIASGDDDLFVNEVAQRNNTAICIDPNTFVYSDAKETWRAYFRQKRRHMTTGHFYRWQHQLLLGIQSLSHILHFFLFVFLLLADFGTVFVFVLYVIRILSLILVCAPTLRKLQESRLIPFIPIFDAALAVFYVVFAPTVFLHTFNNKVHQWA